MLNCIFIFYSKEILKKTLAIEYKYIYIYIYIYIYTWRILYIHLAYPDNAYTQHTVDTLGSFRHSIQLLSNKASWNGLQMDRSRTGRQAVYHTHKQGFTPKDNLEISIYLTWMSGLFEETLRNPSWQGQVWDKNLLALMTTEAPWRTLTVLLIFMFSWQEDVMLKD